jgi:hypothetical protein
MEPELPGTSATKLFEDKTPNAIILNRILLNSLNIAAHDDLQQADGSELIDLTVLLSRKLLSVWKHLQAYQAQERALAEQAGFTLIIDAREQVNHGMAGGMKIERFAVYRDAAGTVHLPMWNNQQRLADAMVIVWQNLFHYVEDFIVLAINFRLKPEFILVRREMPLTSPVPSWVLTTRQETDEFLRRRTPTKTI